MYLHLGNNMVIRKQDVVGIFDLDNTSQSWQTRHFLSAAEQKKQIHNSAGAELPKSFVIRAETGENAEIYLSQLNSSTLARRCEGSGFEGME